MVSSQVPSHLVPINGTQRDAVLSIKNRLNVIQGPPGTGKSTTIFHIANSWLNQPALRNQKCCLLVTCVTNVAVDSVMEKLKVLEGVGGISGPDSRGGIKSVVLGSSRKVGESSKPFLLQNKLKRCYPDWFHKYRRCKKCKQLLCLYNPRRYKHTSCWARFCTT